MRTSQKLRLKNHNTEDTCKNHDTTDYYSHIYMYVYRHNTIIRDPDINKNMNR